MALEVRGAAVLEGRHMISVMVYLLDHDGCRKSDIYQDISRSPRFPDKLELLESNGLITMRPVTRDSVLISLTELGEEVALHLKAIGELMTETET